LCLKDVDYLLAERSRIDANSASPDKVGSTEPDPWHRRYELELNAAIAYLQQRPWRHGSLDKDDVLWLTVNAFGEFRDARDPGFAFWLLTPMVKAYPANNAVRGMLAYVYAYSARELDRSGHPGLASAALSDAWRCCTVADRALATQLRDALMQDLPSELRLEELDLSELDPAHPSLRRQAESAEREEISGEELVRKGNLSGALRKFEDSLAIVNRLAASDPRESQWPRTALLYGTQIAQTLAAQGDYAGALRQLRTDVSRAKQLRASHPDDLSWSSALVTAYVLMGEPLKELGDSGAEIESYRRALRLAQEAAADDRTDAELQEKLFLVRYVLGDALRSRGDLTGALENFLAGAQIAGKRTTAMPADIRWRINAAAINREAGEIFSALGKPAQALEGYKASVALTEKLVISTSSDAMWREEILGDHLKLGEAYRAQGSVLEAFREFQNGIDAGRKLTRTDGADPDVLATDLIRLCWELGLLPNYDERVKRARLAALELGLATFAQVQRRGILAVQGIRPEEKVTPEELRRTLSSLRGSATQVGAMGTASVQ
jgi:tetratricopeptide (TPR) repeat protein